MLDHRTEEEQEMQNLAEQQAAIAKLKGLAKVYLRAESPRLLRCIAAVGKYLLI